MQKHLLSTLFLLFVYFNIFAQQPPKLNSSEIYSAIKKLNFLGSVLYVAAHPDDENTRLIAYFENHVHARTAYLSLTRGDGGQNLIGPEIRELLGVIRTQELLTARQIDGGEQWFTRANDFGFSKHPDETFAIWDKNKVLNDVVLAIRTFKPDIIINRFDHRSPGSTHGHHTGSAILSLEAFNLSGDKNQFPEQLKYTTVWQPKRLFFNTSWWFYGSEEAFKKADKTNLFTLDIGRYSPVSGFSNSEIAALSRSQHKSQGFGNTGTRGSELEYLELLKEHSKHIHNTTEESVFSGINTTWSRVSGGEAIGEILKAVENNFDFTNPAASVPQLMKAYQLIEALSDSHWKNIKSKEIKDIISACAGLYLEAVAETNHATTNDTINLKIEAINRSNLNIVFESFHKNDDNREISQNLSLENNQSMLFNTTYYISPKEAFSTPYWLKEKGTLGMYTVEQPNWIGLPETPKSTTITFNLKINDIPISYTKPIVYKTNDPVKGEVYKPFEVVPEVSSKISEKVIIFETDKQQDITVVVNTKRDNLEGFVTVNHPEDWQVFPEKQKFKIAHKNQEQTLVFTVIPPKNQSEGYLSPEVHVNDKIYSKELTEIDYDHIPFQTVLLPNESKVVRLDITKKGENIGYIMGAGDVVPESLTQIGYQVTLLKPETINAEILNTFDAVVIGIRAYNTVNDLQFKQQQLFDYVANGGNIIVQYNTNRGLVTNKLAPFDLQLSRDRVTDENAKITFLHPNHPVLNVPNKITAQDFEGWTQERGLYFPDEWGDEFTPILSMHDKGETPKQGSLLVAKYGKGYYIYTGLSFFREFPAGVSGAYRLFANMLSLGK